MILLEKNMKNPGIWDESFVIPENPIPKLSRIFNLGFVTIEMIEIFLISTNWHRDQFGHLGSLQLIKKDYFRN